MRLRAVLLGVALLGLAWGAAKTEPGSANVQVVRVPEGGLQPQVAVDGKGVVHLIYFKGEAGHGDVFYVRSNDHGKTFSAPLRVNSQQGSAVATGTIRGAQIAVGGDGRVHVAWNGSTQALPAGPVNTEAPQQHSAPMLYARLNERGMAFEPQRNLMQTTFGLDGGGAVAADRSGGVYVAWHGKAPGAPKGEAGRSLWLARSSDNGKTFAAEKSAWNEPTGACACCGVRLFVDHKGTVYGLYRSATNNVNRDIYLVTSKDRGASFQGTLLHKWDINACPMSSMSFAEGPQGVVAAWQTEGQIYYAKLDAADPSRSRPVAAAGEGKGRKHPVLAVNAQGEMILAWTEGTGWQKGGTLAWQVFDREGRPVGEMGHAPDIPVWSFATVFARSDGGFEVLH